MTPCCPRCGSDETTWSEIIGDVASPTGSRYTCEDCGASFDDRPDDVPASQLAGGRP